MGSRFVVLALSLCVLCAASANAEDLVPSRDIQAAVDRYLASSGDEAALVGGPGSSGYDAGFWIRGGDFMLRINATLQARFESFDWDDEDPGAQTGLWAGDLSGFSLPRATLKLSGEAPCDVCYYVELEFGHWGRDAYEIDGDPQRTDNTFVQDLNQYLEIERNYDPLREAWIEWCSCDAFNFRMGQVKLPSTRQLMVAPELQQFVDVSLASAFTGQLLPGYTDRNRDHGLLVHGRFGCEGAWSYMLAITNGDGGDSIRNVLDHRTSDNLAFGGRLNWAFLGPIGYEEGALRQQTCGWAGELGVWAHYYADRSDKPHLTVRDALRYGIDVALGYGGFSFTGAYTRGVDEDVGGSGNDVDYSAWLAQLGYHLPGTAWEFAARASAYDVDPDAGGLTPFGDGSVTEYAFAITYYLNGHGNKLQVDVSFISGDDPGSTLIWDPLPGYANRFTGEEDAILLRFQWQLSL